MGIVGSWRAAQHVVNIISPPNVDIEKSDGKKGKGRNQIGSLLSKHLPEILFEIFEIAYNLWAYYFIGQKLKRFRYDLIYERYSFLCFAGLLAARRYKIPFFLEVNYFTKTPIVRRRTFFVRPVERIIEKALFEKADGIIVVSTYLRKQLESQGISPYKILVVPNAADPSKFDPTKTGNGIKKRLSMADKRVVGFIGYFYPWHGIELLLKAFPLLKKEIKEVGYLLIGDGPIFPKIQEAVTSNNFQEDIIMTGKVPHGEVPNLISAFDIAVMPHSNVYGSPMKILEYMAMGKAVVAPRLGPLEDVIDDGKTGLLFEPENAEDLTQKILKLLLDEKLRETLGSVARESIIKEHNWEHRAQNILALYNNSVKRKRS
jgi:glycosyltransferase involved in cell wall biosynthesis